MSFWKRKKQNNWLWDRAVRPVTRWPIKRLLSEPR